MLNLTPEVLGAAVPADRFDSRADGMAVDRSGGVWMCIPHRDRGVVRFDPAGRLTTRVRAVGITAIACALDTAEEALYFVGIETLSRGTNLFEVHRVPEP